MTRERSRVIRPTQRTVVRVLASLLLAVSAAVVAMSSTTAPASAHAMLMSTTPAADTVLPGQPDQVLLTFSENVTVESDGVNVYDADLHRVDAGDAGPRTDRTDTIGVGLHRGLPAGSYTVTWQVISADTHPVSGGFTFSVGHRGRAPAPTSSQSGTWPAPQLAAAFRWVGYLGAVTAIGVAVMLLLLWREGRSDRRVRRLIASGCALLVVGAVGQFLVQGPYETGRPITSALDPHVMDLTSGTRLGYALLVRIGLVVVLSAALAVAVRPGSPRRDRLSVLAAATAATAVLTSMAAVGHQSTGSMAGLSTVLDLVHLAAMTFWLGGLVLIVGCLSRRDRENVLAAALPRFSRVAMVCVALLVGTGVFAAWRNVRYLHALVSTEYGLILIAKLGAVAVLLLLGDFARRRVRRRAVRADSISTLRRSIAVEAAIAVGVLALSAALTGSALAKDTYAPDYRAEQTADDVHVSVTVSPARTGSAALTVTVSGAPALSSVDGSLTLADRGIGPIPVAFTIDGDVAHAHVQFAAAGNWDLDMTVQTSATSATAYRIGVPVI